MIPATFDYERAASADEAIASLGEHGDDAKLLAGGHSLLPLMKLRLASPSVLIDVGRLTDLSYIRDGGDHIAIGALTRHRDLETSDLLKQQVPLLAHAAGHVGDPQVRHRGTIGGSLAHADPAVRPAGRRARARRHAGGPGPERRRGRSPRPTSYQGFLESALAPDELLTEIRVPKVAGAGWSFQKFNRRAQDWAIVGVAAWRSNGDTGVALVNMGSTPVLARRSSSRRSPAAPRRPTPPSRRRRRHRAASRPQRQRRVPRPPGQGAGAASAGGSQRLAPPPATTRSSSERDRTACRPRSPWPRPAVPCSSSKAGTRSAAGPARPS